MIGLRAVMAGGLLLAMAGCAQWQPRPPVTLTELSGRISGPDWLDEVRQVQQLPAEEQAAALRARQHAYRNEATTVTRLRLALVRALGGEEVRNDTAALALLDEIDPLLMGADAAVLVKLLKQQLQEKQWALGQLRDERKVVAERDSRIQELETQLEAVTSIEQSIKQRQKALQGVKP